MGRNSASLSRRRGYDHGYVQLEEESQHRHRSNKGRHHQERQSRNNKKKEDQSDTAEVKSRRHRQWASINDVVQKYQPQSYGGERNDGSDASKAVLKKCQKCGKRRERRHKATAIEPPPPPQYHNLLASEDEDAKRMVLKKLEKERRRQARCQVHRDRNAAEESSRKQPLKQTSPVYMPRSKYYPDRDAEISTEKSSTRSVCDLSHRHHHRRLDSSEYERSNRSRDRRHHQSTREESSIKEPRQPPPRVPIEDDNDSKYYVGPQTPKAVVEYLKPNEFRICYQLPENSSIVPYKLRLFLAYMSSQSKEVYHFPVICGKNSRTGEKMWSLRYADSATFSTLSALIKYHKTYAYMDPETGKIDTFPIWKDAQYRW